MSISRRRARHANTTVVLVVVVLLLVFASVAAFVLVLQEESDAPAEQMNRVQVEYLVHQEVNEERVERGLEPLEFDTELRAIARDYSEQMAREGFFGHYDAEGRSFEDRYRRADYDCSVPLNETHALKGGENLAKTYYDQPVNTSLGTEDEYKTLDALAEGVVRGWMNSPDHRDNLLTPEWRREGIGVYVTENDTVYVTQNFC